MAAFSRMAFGRAWRPSLRVRATPGPMTRFKTLRSSRVVVLRSIVGGTPIDSVQLFYGPTTNDAAPTASEVPVAGRLTDAPSRPLFFLSFARDAGEPTSSARFVARRFPVGCGTEHCRIITSRASIAQFHSASPLTVNNRNVVVRLTFHLTQALTGHGCFQDYLHRRGRAATPLCLLCGVGAEDTVEHTLLECAFWEQERSVLARSARVGTVGVADMTEMVCGPDPALLPEDDPGRRKRILAAAQSVTDAFLTFVEAVLGRKEALERDRQRAERRRRRPERVVRLCSAVEADPWGLPYRVVTKKIRRQPGLEARGRELGIADQLFPLNHVVDWSRVDLTTLRGDSASVTSHPSDWFSEEEFRSAICRIPSGKAPGPDGIPNEVLRQVSCLKPSLLQGVFNLCLRSKVFPSIWKRAKLVLLHKGPGKPTSEASSFRPLSLLNAAGKLFERLILGRLVVHLNTPGLGLNQRQFGFRRGRSTVGAISRVLGIAREAARGAVQNRHLCAMVSLDVRNAFNSAPWEKIDGALRRKQVPRYLVELIRSYLSDRMIVVGERRVFKEVTCGVPQGSVLGPTLWNVFYDSLLDLEMPSGIELVAFADDVAVVGVAHTGELLAQILNPALDRVARWMRDNGLKLAAHKTVAVLLTKKNVYTLPELLIEGQPVEFSRSVRYLGVEIDQRLTFTGHVGRVAKAAAETAMAICRLMPNVGGPSAAKRRLLGTVVQSKLLYAAPIWADTAFSSERNRGVANRQQRRVALRVIRAYRTVSDQAAMVLAELPPIDLLASERGRVAIALSKDAIGMDVRTIKAAERGVTISEWGARWQRTEKAAWTRYLIPDLAGWLTRVIKVTPTYHLTQVLTGHGCFQAYLYRMGLAGSPECLLCGHVEDSVEHTIVDCPYWNNERVPVLRMINGGQLSVNLISKIICGPSRVDLPPQGGVQIVRAAQALCDCFVDMCHSIMLEKEKLERGRQAEERTAVI
ncbi:Reverse transcriptase domain [Cinara cedri]|uniref:Reverse transcriptase domain n=1 Tax=Cinara cedri TaxID=506608 RepID=A0A5E4MW71_9HEMI|nr:Reverse transcriptase domain [Cinara cedri]